MESILEAQRNRHEERERLIEAMTRETIVEKRSHKALVNSQHRVRSYADRYLASTEELEKMYIDSTQERHKEVEAISGPNEFAEFYARLKTLKDYHKRAGDEPAQCLALDFQQIFTELANPEREEPDMVTFTDEEGYGRFLDLHQCYDKYLNLKGIKRIDYMSYLNLFEKLDTISKSSTKKTGAYKDYVETMKNYLVNFLNRTKPMMDVKDQMDKVAADVERLWEKGGVPGWKEQAHQGAMAPGPAPASIDLSGVKSAEELESYGLERLKGALKVLGLKCGGTLKERADRLYATKNKQLVEHDDSSVKKDNNKESLRNKQLATLEMQVLCLMGLLQEERDATKENVERKQARGGAEESEEEEEVYVEVEEPEVDDSIPYNPKNLPLDWDGKPIPYWLYKLHGLNISYSCEICGNQKYKGPKAFQRHFSEWRHSHSMRCLGIPNTAHFMNITKIAEALALWNKMKKDQELTRWNPELDEEYEDSAGNVVNKRTYEDLKRQGLL
ncbi:unnamed protein product, partial [Mesorhabditis belari]|uniref:Matrin-type domain-containing protein n=1 Tax=Mesorhabditis belari TaxID=2138241 RepID=A0AAF3FPC2_9BILA